MRFFEETERSDDSIREEKGMIYYEVILSDDGTE